MKKALAYLCACFMLLGLTGCNVFAGQNVGDLLRAPALGQGYDEIQKTLAAYLGDEEPQYQFPKEGDWRSPLIRADLDGDGNEEAVLLYSMAENTQAGRERGSNVYVAVLERQAEGWQVLCDEPGMATDVASLEVADLLGDGTQQLIVGFANATMTAKTFALYTYSSGALQLVRTLEYSRYEIADFTGRGGSDLVVVSPDDKVGGLQLYYIPTLEGIFSEDALEAVKLDANFVSCSGIYPSFGAEGEQIMVVDGLTVAGGLASSVVYFSGERFYTIDDSGAFLGATARMNPLLRARDIDGDGVTEIPVRVGKNEVQTPQGDKHLEFVEWKDFTTEAEPVAKQYGLLDSDRGVYIRLPDEWRGKIDVVDGAEQGEWRIQSKSTMRVLVTLRVIEAGDTLPINAQRLPGSTSSYLVFQSGLPEAERQLITMVSLA